MSFLIREGPLRERSYIPEKKEIGILLVQIYKTIPADTGSVTACKMFNT